MQTAAVKWVIALSLTAGVVDLGVINLVLAPRLNSPAPTASAGDSRSPAAVGMSDPTPPPSALHPASEPPSAQPPPSSARAESGEPVASAEAPTPTGSGDEEADDASPREVVIRFASSSVKLSDEARRTLVGVAETHVERPDWVAVVRGHADERGSYAENHRLSYTRAYIVLHHLVQAHGLDKSRMRVESLGESEPLSHGHTAEDWAANRRVEIRWEPKGG